MNCMGAVKLIAWKWRYFHK